MAPKRRKVEKITANSFRESTSEFGAKGEKSLNIKIVHTDKSENIFLEIPDDLEEDVEDLLLTEYTPGKVLEYVASPDDNLNKNQRKFIQKLRLVMLNNTPDTDDSNCGLFVDDLVYLILDTIGFDDGAEFFLLPCRLKLTIGEEEFAAKADKEGRKGTELIWLIQEDKHESSTTYKHRDLRLACAMIAAFQRNYNRLEEVYPDKLVGIKIIADKFCFASMMMEEEYLEELMEGLPESSVTMYVYPKDGLRLRDPKHREHILRLLQAMKEEGKALEKI